MGNKKEKSKMKSIFWILLAISVFVFLGVVSQAKSIAYIVNEQSTHDSVAKAFDACEDKRQNSIREGQDCEPCYLSCPSDINLNNDGTYTFSYSEQSTIYSGTFENLQCDRIGDSAGRLLQVKSYCNDAIRLCEEQDGTGSVVSTEQVDHGEIKLLSYRVWITDCDSGSHLGDSYPIEKYRLYCDDDYAVNGRKISEYKWNLGYCDPIYQEDKPDDVLPLSGKITQVTFDERAGFSEEVRVRGTFVPDVDGRYYIYGTILESERTSLSVVTGFGVQDLCSNDQNVAGVFLDLNAGDTALFELSIPAPNNEGNYPVEVAVRDGCYGDDFDIKQGSVRVVSDQDLEDEVIDETVTDDPGDAEDEKDDAVSDLEDIINIEDCTGEEDLTLNGCEVAECINGEIYLLSDEEIDNRCDDDSVSDTINDAKDQINKDYNPEFIFDPSTFIGKLLIGVGAFIVVMIIGILIISMPRRRS